MRSYWACVPTNFTQTMPARYCISTTRRYLLPPTLNTTRWLPQMLAFAYWSLTSCGDRHVALTASSYQLCSGPRASPQRGRSQNFFKLLLAITLIDASISHFGRSSNSACPDLAWQSAMDAHRSSLRHSSLLKRWRNATANAERLMGTRQREPYGDYYCTEKQFLASAPKWPVSNGRSDPPKPADGVHANASNKVWA